MFFTQTIAAADPVPFRRPRFIRWPSVCDTNRTNWLNPAEDSPPLPETQSQVEYVGCHRLPDDPRLQAATSTSSLTVSPPLQSDPTWHSSAAAAPSPQISGPHSHLLTSLVVTAGLGIDPQVPPKGYSADDQSPKSHSAADNPPPQGAKKTGRPPLFDEFKRREFCAMVRTGCSLRNAAKHAGVKMASVYYACRTDPKFAEILRAAERDRDTLGVRRIQNAGEKSWRAAAWLLERAEPKHFSLAAQRKSDPLKYLGRRRFKQLVTEVVQQVLPQCQENESRRPMSDLACQLVDNRLDEIQAQLEGSLDPHNEDSMQDELDSDSLVEGALQQDETRDDESDDDDAAEAAYQNLLQLLHNRQPATSLHSSKTGGR